jgi:hypothetical protein
LDKLAILKFWPIQAKTNLTQDEIKSLEEAWFVQNKQQLIFPWSLFGGESSIPINKLVDEMSWPTSCNGKAIRCIMPFKMSNSHYNWWEVGQLFEAIVNPPLEVPPPIYGLIYKILSNQNPNKKKSSYNRKLSSLHLFGFCSNDF